MESAYEKINSAEEAIESRIEEAEASLGFDVIDEDRIIRDIQKVEGEFKDHMLEQDGVLARLAQDLHGLAKAFDTAREDKIRALFELQVDVYNLLESVLGSEGHGLNVDLYVQNQDALSEVYSHVVEGEVGTVSFELDGRNVELDLDGVDEERVVKSFVIQGLTFNLDDPCDFKVFPFLFVNALQAVGYLEARSEFAPLLQGGLQLRAHDVYNFSFTIENEGGDSLYLATPRGLFRKVERTRVEKDRDNLRYFDCINRLRILRGRLKRQLYKNWDSFPSELHELRKAIETIATNYQTDEGHLAILGEYRSDIPEALQGVVSKILDVGLGWQRLYLFTLSHYTGGVFIDDSTGQYARFTGLPVLHDEEPTHRSSSGVEYFDPYFRTERQVTIFSDRTSFVENVEVYSGELMDEAYRLGSRSTEVSTNYYLDSGTMEMRRRYVLAREVQWNNAQLVADVAYVDSTEPFSGEKNVEGEWVEVLFGDEHGLEPSRNFSESYVDEDGVLRTRYYGFRGGVAKVVEVHPDGMRIEEKYYERFSRLVEKTIVYPDGRRIESMYKHDRVILQTEVNPDGSRLVESFRYDGSLETKVQMNTDGSGLVATYLPDGRIYQDMKKRPDGSTKLKRDYLKKEVTLYDSDGEPKYGWNWENGKSFTFDDRGLKKRLPAYAIENGRLLDDDAYLERLARELDTPKEIHLFFEQNLTYTSDRSEHWQLPQSTVNRLSWWGTMRGDCDDYAFLAREVKQRQGVDAHIIYIPGIPVMKDGIEVNIGHATCVWVEKHDGKYHAFSMGTFGYDHNGNRYGAKQDPEKAKGYDTIDEALNSIFRKFDQVGLGVETPMRYRVTDRKVVVMDLSEDGKMRYKTPRATNTLFPVDIFKSKEK